MTEPLLFADEDFPLDTTIAAASMVFGGVFDRHPKLKVALAHGGGFTPYQAPRWTHGWVVRPAARPEATSPGEAVPAAR